MVSKNETCLFGAIVYNFDHDMFYNISVFNLHFFNQNTRHSLRVRSALTPP